jgi:hypothetical protein
VSDGVKTFGYIERHRVNVCTETFVFILSGEHRLRDSENRMLRKIFGPKMEEDGSWR